MARPLTRTHLGTRDSRFGMWQERDVLRWWLSQKVQGPTYKYPSINFQHNPMVAETAQIVRDYIQVCGAEPGVLINRHINPLEGNGLSRRMHGLTARGCPGGTITQGSYLASLSAPPSAFSFTSQMFEDTFCIGWLQRYLHLHL